MNTEELIQSYIANRLSEKDKERVEKLLKTDSEFKEAFTTHKELADAFQLSKSNEIKKRLQKLEATTSTISRIKKRYLVKLSRVAVAAVVIFGIYYMNTSTNSNDDIFDSYFEICPNTYMPVTRGDNSKDAKFQAFKAYERANFKTAETAFDKVLKTTTNPNISFYYAMSLLNQDKFESALQLLKKLSNEKFEYQVESLWYTALIEIKNKDIENAKQHLLAIQKLNADFKSNEIQAILNTL